MIELPEALAIARQMSDALKGKRIASAVRGNAPHKFAFYSGSPEEYAAILAGKTIGEATGHGSAILAAVEPDYVLGLGSAERGSCFTGTRARCPRSIISCSISRTTHT